MTSLKVVILFMALFDVQGHSAMRCAGGEGSHIPGYLRTVRVTMTSFKVAVLFMALLDKHGSEKSK